jgi:hypothetical protein
MKLPKISLKKKQKSKPLDEKTITAILQRQLEIHEEQNREYLKRIENDKEKQRIWNSLSTSTKIRLLKRNLERGGINAKKQVSTKGSWFKKQKKEKV